MPTYVSLLRAMATKYSAIIGPPMVNAPAQHPEKALHTSPAARPGWSSFTRLAKSRKYAASTIRNAPNSAVSTCRSKFPSRLMMTRLHTVYSPMGSAICFTSMCLRYIHVMVPDWAMQISATMVGAMVMS